MRDEALISMQGTIVRIACQRMRSAYLKALSDSVQQAACLPVHLAWDRKAAAHAELFNLLGDATGDPVLARLAGVAVGWTHTPGGVGRAGGRRHHPQLAPPAARLPVGGRRRRRGARDGAPPVRIVLHEPGGRALR